MSQRPNSKEWSTKSEQRGSLASRNGEDGSRTHSQLPPLLVFLSQSQLDILNGRRRGTEVYEELRGRWELEGNESLESTELAVMNCEAALLMYEIGDLPDRSPWAHLTTSQSKANGCWLMVISAVDNWSDSCDFCLQLLCTKKVTVIHQVAKRHASGTRRGPNLFQKPTCYWNCWGSHVLSLGALGDKSAFCTISMDPSYPVYHSQI